MPASLRRALPWLAATLAVVSLTATAGHLFLDWPATPPWGLIEVGVASVLVALLARWCPPRVALVGGVPAGVAAALSLLRAGDDAQPELSALEAVYAVSFWALGPIAGAAVGLYLRHLDHRRAEAVAAARQEQRLELARDLHDYVAHDVSEMIAHAQAALVSGRDEQASAALRRIEVAGLKAMEMMDRTVRMLHDDPEAAYPTAAKSPPGIAELPELTRRFAESSAAEVHLEIEPGLEQHAPRELTGTVYRIVLEALTNVRRHAPEATTVDVRVRRIGGDLTVSVSNDLGGATTGRLGRPGGVGLAALTERVGALAGALEAGPYESGWRLSARLPLARRPDGAVPT